VYLIGSFELVRPYGSLFDAARSRSRPYGLRVRGRGLVFSVSDIQRPNFH